MGNYDSLLVTVINFEQKSPIAFFIILLILVPFIVAGFTKSTYFDVIGINKLISIIKGNKNNAEDLKKIEDDILQKLEQNKGDKK